MLLRETGFTFHGVHSRGDMGLIYAEKDGHAAWPEIGRNEYEISGVDGTILLPGERRKALTFEGTLYPASEPETQAEAQALLRRIAAWLTAGRYPLIFDYEPEVFYLAQFTGVGKWSLKNWFGGEIGVKFTAQPWAYAVTPTIVTEESSFGAPTVTLTLDTGAPAPLTMEIASTGTETIQGVDIGDDIVIRGLTMATGSVLRVQCEPPVGVTIDGANAMPKVEAFAPMMMQAGANAIQVRLYGDGVGTLGVRIRAGARGRW